MAASMEKGEDRGREVTSPGTCWSDDGHHDEDHHDDIESHHLPLKLKSKLNHETRLSAGSSKLDRARNYFTLEQKPAPHRVPSNIANPAPLGLMCFGMTTMMLMCIETGWVQGGYADVVTCYAIFYGGATQLLAGIFEMIKGNTFAATAFSSYGAFWLGWGLLRILHGEDTLHWGASSPGYITAEKLFCIQWGCMTFGFFLCTFKKAIVLRVVFCSLWITFFLLAAGQTNDSCREAAGYVGFFCASSAMYGSIGELLAETYSIHVPGIN